MRYKLASALRVHEAELAFAVKNLASNLVPIWPDEVKGTIQTASGGGTYFCQQLWSRGLGSAVDVVIGAPEDVESIAADSLDCVVKQMSYIWEHHGHGRKTAHIDTGSFSASPAR